MISKRGDDWKPLTETNCKVQKTESQIGVTIVCIHLQKQGLKSQKPSLLSQLSENSMTQSLRVVSRLGRYAPTMELLQASSVRIFGALLLFFAVRYVYGRLEVAISRHRTARKHDCKPVKLSPALNTFSNNMFGWKIPILLLNGFKARKVLETIQKVFFESCNTVQVKLLSTNMIFTIEPENIKTILASNFNDWSITTRRKHAFGPYIGHGILTADGLKWKHSRELLKPNFARSQIDNPATLEPHVSTLLDAIPRDGSTFDLQELFFRCTTDAAIDFLFGLDPSTSKEFSTVFTKALDHLSRAAIRAAYFGRLMNLSKAFSKKDVNTVHEFIDHYIDLAIKDRKNYVLGRIKGERYVFLREVVQRTQDSAQIGSEILNILQAGKDTTASLLSNTWFTLAKRPDVWANLRAEVDDLNGEKPSFAALKEMKYLKAVLNEGRVYITHHV